MEHRIDRGDCTESERQKIYCTETPTINTDYIRNINEQNEGIQIETKKQHTFDVGVN